MSDHTIAPASPFARSCQAAHLLSHIIRHINEEQTDAQLHYQEAIQLHRTIDNFSIVISQEVTNITSDEYNSIPSSLYFTAMAICYSAQLALYDARMCPDADDVPGLGMPEQLEMQQIAMTGIKSTCFAIHNFGNMISGLIERRGFSQLSPFVADCLYQACMLIRAYIHGTENHEYRQIMEEMVLVLGQVSKRWDVASK